MCMSKGRLETVPVSPEFTLMIDYAHNAMALESLLKSLKEYHPKRLVTLFGCGGNRDPHRRYEMGEVSANLSDLTVVTPLIRDLKNRWRSSKIFLSALSGVPESM